MNLWLQRLRQDTLREAKKERVAKVDQPKKRRGRKPKLQPRWHPLLDDPCDPPYYPKVGHTVRVRSRIGTVEQYEELFGEVTSVHPVEGRPMVSIRVQNCCRAMCLWWKGTKWECHAGPFCFEIEVARCEDVETGRYAKSEYHKASARLKAQRDRSSL